MEFNENNAIDENDFDSDYHELTDNLDELELSDEDLDVYQKKLNSVNENFIKDSGFFSNFLNNSTPFLVFRSLS